MTSPKISAGAVESRSKKAGVGPLAFLLSAKNVGIDRPPIWADKLHKRNDPDLAGHARNEE